MKNKFEHSFILICKTFLIFLILYSCSTSSENDTEPPTVVITYPVNGDSLSDSTIIRVDVVDNDGIKNVQFLVDGIIVGDDVSIPYEYNWNLSLWADGKIHTILAKATDNSDNISQSALVSVTVLEVANQDSLIIFYPFNGNANDESGNGYNGRVHGALLTVDRFGNSNSAYSFNGVNNYIDISYSDLQPDVLFQNSFSVEAWIKLNSTSGTQTICSFGYDTGDPMLFEIHEGKMRIHMELQGGDYKPANSTLVVNVWYHVKLVGDLGKGITFYLNDIEDGKETVWGSMNGTMSAIGAGYDGSPGRFFNGVIDDFKIIIK